MKRLRFAVARLRRVWSRRATAAALACAGAMVLALIAAERAIRLDPIPRPASPPSGPATARIGARVDTTSDVVRLASARHPFRPERRPPAERFRMPGESLVGEADTMAPAQATGLRLIGTAVTAPGRGFAMCQAGDAAPRLVRVGETLAGFTLRSVERGRALFRAPDGGTLDLRVPKAGT